MPAPALAAAAPYIIGGLQALGSGLSGRSQSREQRRDRAERRRQFDLEHALRQAADRRSQGEYNATVASRTETDPARRAMAERLFERLMNGQNLPWASQGGAAPPTPGGPPGAAPPPPPEMMLPPQFAGGPTGPPLPREGATPPADMAALLRMLQQMTGGGIGMGG